ncbi:sensor histidine kinase [Humisphaera borealis]|uniref:histidine kinase n=1 Tax=Humisphaera borealis TaxID=2807512 RepID=A0A7M2WVD2_9BACT|nr:sensor histidine kinase [Humisphaera borealis]QOV89383.1 sensor histidine kinase [Humisphaera borealis]
MSPLSPVRVFGLVLLVVFCVEGAIMLLLPRLPTWLHGELMESLLDAAVLTIATAPAVWWLAILPLRQLFEERGRLLKRMFESQEQERARIAGDLHDSIGQHLTALLVGLSSIDSAADLSSARERARDLRELGAQAHDEVRRLARGLRPAVLEDLGIGPAVERLCKDFERVHDVAIRLKSEVSRRLDPTVEISVYRIVQEALNNIAKHAAARRAAVDITVADGALSLLIEDDGRGFDAGAPLLESPSGGLGLRGIRERVALLHGEFRVKSSRGGTAIHVRIPLEP